MKKRGSKNWIPAAFFFVGWFGAIIFLTLTVPDLKGEELGPTLFTLFVGGAFIYPGVMLQRRLLKREHRRDLGKNAVVPETD